MNQAMLKNLYYKITGDPNEKEVKAIQPLVAEINALEPVFTKLTDDDAFSQNRTSFAPAFMNSVDAERAEAFLDLRNNAGWTRADENQRQSRLERQSITDDEKN